MSAIKRLNAAQLEAARKEGYKDGFYKGQQVYQLEEYLRGYKEGCDNTAGIYKKIVNLLKKRCITY